MTGRDTEYYLDILKRVRKGKPPADEGDLYVELLAFDFMYSLSMLYARKHSDVEDVDLELPWRDSMLLDCGKLSSILAYELKSDDSWEEVKQVFEPYVVRHIEELASAVDDSNEDFAEDVFGGFAFSEFVNFKKMLERITIYRGASKASAHSRLMQTMADILLNSPTVNGIGDGDI